MIIYYHNNCYSGEKTPLPCVQRMSVPVQGTADPDPDTRGHINIHLVETVHVLAYSEIEIIERPLNPVMNIEMNFH